MPVRKNNEPIKMKIGTGTSVKLAIEVEELATAFVTRKTGPL